MRLLRMFVGLALSNLFFLLPMQAQLIFPKSGETLPTFEVATIKPGIPHAPTQTYWLFKGPLMDNVPLSEIIRDAYDAHSSAQLIGGPQALLEQRFDLRTKIDPADVAKLKNMSPNDRSRRMRLMLQALLRDRFDLKMHVEKRELPVYALVVAKGGPKLQPTAPADSTPAPQTHAAAQTPSSPGNPPQPPQGMHWLMQSGANGSHMDVSGGTMEELAAALTGQEATEGRLVIDRTGLTGKYDWHLEWTPAGAQMESNGMGGSSPHSDAPALFTALREQLGLRLESQKGPVQVVVIDHLEPPTPN